MAFRDIVFSDLLEIMHDDLSGGHTCSIVSPAGDIEDFQVLSNDIHLSIDPVSGTVVSGRQCSISVLISDLIAAEFENVNGVSEEDEMPWRVWLSDANGIERTFKVSSSNPDYGIGLNTLLLELTEEQDN